MMNKIIIKLSSLQASDRAFIESLYPELVTRVASSHSLTKDSPKEGMYYLLFF
jgi:hypothetical protein